MAKGFRPVDRDQPFLLPPVMRQWLPEGHLAWFVIDAVAALDLARFAARQPPAGSLAGRAGYDPAMLLSLLVYGYAAGVRSSRRIERACCEDVAFRVICAQDAPGHATVARFRREHVAGSAAMADLFGQVLVLAARAGLGRLGLIAVDGTKIAAAASKDAGRAERRLRELARQILAGAEATDAAEDELSGEARGDELPAELADPTTRAERIRAALARARAPGPLHRRRAKIGTALAGAGYCSEAGLTMEGPGRLIATGKQRDLEKAAQGSRGPGPPAHGEATAAMAARLASPQGIAAYRRRGPLAEGPFGNIKHNRGFRRFSMRGLQRASGEWAFQNTVTNLLKIHATLTPPAPA